MPKDAATLAGTATLIGDPARASMLAALLDGRALTATELARCAGIAPQTASGHLAKLTARGLVAVTRQGRHRYHRLASPAIATMLETIMSVAPATATIAVGTSDPALRRARSCYDHLAGAVAVAIADRMVARGHLVVGVDGAALTADGEAFLARALAIELGDDRRDARRFCRPCLDWTERRPHVAGAVGAALLTTCLARRWVRRRSESRALAITPAGQIALRSHFEITVAGPR